MIEENKPATVPSVDDVVMRLAKRIQWIEHAQRHTWDSCSESARARAIEQAKACVMEISGDYDRIKAEVIRMRDYAMRKGIPIGDCVAWSRIKDYYGTGRRDEEDFDWLEEYERRNQYA